MTLRRAPLLALAAVALAGCMQTQHMFTSPGQAIGLTLLVILIGMVGVVIWKRPSPHEDALDAQPLLPGETRWIIGRDGTVTDSCTHKDETGIATGWAVGHPISTWAPTGSEQAEHYRAALEDRRPSTFEARHLDASGTERVTRTALQPRADGSVYCEAWDVTDYVRARQAETERADAADARATLAEDRVTELMRYASTDAVALFDKHADTATAR